MANQHMVVVGASLAGVRAAEGARQSGFLGHITLLGAEPHLPYDRPPLSKGFLESESPLDEPLLYGASAYSEELGVELVLGASATMLDTQTRTVFTAERSLVYDRLIIASGSVPRALSALASMPGTHLLRTLDDAVAIRRAMATARRVVVIGAGFIGAEVASSARRRGRAVTIVEAGSAPLERSVGAEMGAGCSALHYQNSTDLRCGVTVTSCEGRSHIEKVHLSDGSTLDADLVVAGLGADPATGWLSGSGLQVDDGVICDTTLATDAPGVYAAGDVARWHNTWSGTWMRLQHWTSAAAQGAIAGRNAALPERAREYSAVPHFWSDWYGHRIQFFGISECDERRMVFGSPEESCFVALYRKGDRLVGALAVDAQTDIVRYHRLLRRRASWDEALEFAHSRKYRGSGIS